MSLEEETKEALKAILKCRSAKRHARIWELLLTGFWVEAVEASRNIVGAATARGIAHYLATEYRKQPKSNAKFRIKKALNHVERIHLEIESGTLVPEELKNLTSFLGTVGATQDNLKRGRELVELLEGYTCAPSLPPAPAHTHEAAPVIAAASEPTAQIAVLKARAARLSKEFPAPDLVAGTGGQSSIGRAKPSERAAWIRWIDQISRRWAGPLYASDLVSLSGAPFVWCNAMLNEYRALLSEGLTQDQRRALTLGMITEVEGIARESLALATATDDERAKGAALKLALDCIDRRSKLVGVSSLEYEQPAKTKQITADETAARLGFDNELLRQIGDLASKKLNS